MDQFISKYIQQMEKEIEEVKQSIVKMKGAFGLTNWTDLKSMIESANEIWELEERLKIVNDVNKIILENYRTGN